MAFVGRFMDMCVCTVYIHPNTQYKNSRYNFVKSPANHLRIQNLSKNEAHLTHLHSLCLYPSSVQLSLSL